MSNTNQKLAAVVCGMPFSGTTYLSRMISAHPLIDSGFECGLLFGNTPKQFPESGRYYEWMMDLKPPYNWNLTQEQLDEVCHAASFGEAYAKIVQHCHLFQGSKELVLDKTPAYIYQLKEVMNKVQNVPFVITQKAPLNQYYSFKKRDQSLDFFLDRYAVSKQAIDEVLADSELRDRLLVMQFADLVEMPGKSYRKIMQFIGRFVSDVAFDKEQVPQLNASLKSDMKGKKKLRQTFSVEQEQELLRKALTPKEIETVTQLEV